MSRQHDLLEAALQHDVAPAEEQPFQAQARARVGRPLRFSFTVADALSEVAEVTDLSPAAAETASRYASNQPPPLRVYPFSKRSPWK